MSQIGFGMSSSLMQNWTGLNSGQFPDPFFDYASTVMPETMQLALRWCEYIFMSNGTYRQAIDRIGSYFITDLEIGGKDVGDDVKDQWKQFFEEDLDYRNILHIAHLDTSCYGNGFFSVLPAFKRYLSCAKCYFEAPLRKIYNEPTFRFQWTDFEPHAQCPKCGYSGRWHMIDRRSADNGGFFIKRWNPHEMELLWDPYTDQTAYIWKIPEDYRKMLREGHLYHLERATKEIIQAVKNNNYILFDKDVIYHMKEDALAGVRNRGWGISKVLANFRQAWYVQVLHRYNEAIALDYVIPFRLITPVPNEKGAASDPVYNQNLGGMAAQVNSMIRRRRRDPATWNFLPFAVQYQALGGDATQLAPTELLQQGIDNLLNNIGIPAELFKGSLTLQAAPVALRLFEATHSSVPHNLNGFLRFIMKRTSEILGWEPVTVKLGRVTHADDLNRQQAKLQLMMGGQVSQTTGLKSIGLDFHDETQRQMDDQRYQAEQQAKLTKEMDQAATMEQMNQAPGAGAPGQQQAGGQRGGQQGGQPAQGGDPSQQGAMGQAAQSVTANLPANPNEKVSPEELQERAQYVASQLMGMPESQKDSELRKLKTIDPTLHALVRSIMQDMRRQAQTQGGAQMLSQQFGKQSSAGIAILAGRKGDSIAIENWEDIVRRLPKYKARTIVVD
jgi:hypothetical protein